MSDQDLKPMSEKVTRVLMVVAILCAVAAVFVGALGVRALSTW